TPADNLAVAFIRSCWTTTLRSTDGILTVHVRGQEADEDPVTTSHSLMSVFALDSPSSRQTPQHLIASACLPAFQRNYELRLPRTTHSDWLTTRIVSPPESCKQRIRTIS
ncbi:hypothetical protein CRENBAI_011355, partial [Crenichthys baileyi]